MATLVAGLPQYVVLRSRNEGGRYLHYFWNDEFGDLYKFMGTKRIVDPVNPFVKLEVVPSTTDPSFVHLRCSYNNKFFQLQQKLGVWFITATADSPNENTSTVGPSTLFQPVFPSDMPANTVWFRYVANQNRIFWFNNTSYPDMYQAAIVYSTLPQHTTFYDFAPWESFDDKMKAKDEEIRARDVEIENLNAEVAANAEEIRDLGRQLANRDDEIVKLKAQVASWEAYVEKRKANLEDGMLTLQSAVASAWDAFQHNVRTGIVKIRGGLGKFGKALKLQAS